MDTLTPPDETTPPRQYPGRPAVELTANRDQCLKNIANFWQPYESKRKWADVYPDEVDMLENGVYEHITVARAHGCTWKMVGSAMGQCASGSLRWYQHHGGVPPVPRAKKIP